MTDDIEAAVRSARAELRTHADPVAAVGRKRYLKSPFEVLGCRVPVVNAAGRAVHRACSAPNLGRLVAALDDLWHSPVHDDRVLAIVLAALYRRSFDAGHVQGLFHAWLADSHTWDHVDAICTRVVGAIAAEDAAAWAAIEDWAGDGSMWLRRASVLSHIPAIRRGVLRVGLFQRTCMRLVDEREFFVRKAIGWALRELSLRDPAEAERIVLALGARASGLTLREATRRMPAAQRTRVLRALGR